MPGYVLHELEEDTENDTAKQTADEPADPEGRGQDEVFQTVIQKGLPPVKRIGQLKNCDKLFQEKRKEYSKCDRFNQRYITIFYHSEC